MLETPPAAPDVAVEPNFAESPQPISEYVVRPDFPKCALGAHLDIGGFTGVVIQLVNQSLKVKSPEGVVQSFNSARLRKIYGPMIRSELPEPIRPPESVARVAEPVDEVPAEGTEEPAAPAREYIETPNFEAPLRLITEFAGRPDFPRCAYGEHVDIADYTGVVVEIVKQSLKVKSVDGTLRSYNIPVLRKLYGQA